jgi:hypothetical protein
MLLKGKGTPAVRLIVSCGLVELLVFRVRLPPVAIMQIATMSAGTAVKAYWTLVVDAAALIWKSSTASPVKERVLFATMPAAPE